MNFQNKSALLLSLSVMSPMAFAGPPVAYDEWSVIGGTIDTSLSCSATGVACDTLVSDKGMLYQQVTTGAGAFLRLIITERDATGDPNAPVNDPDALAFSDESFIPFSLYDSAGNAGPLPPAYNSFGAPQGIADKQSIKDTVDNFVATTEVQRGNLRQLSTDGVYGGVSEGGVSADEMFTVKIDQSFSNAEISSDFSYTGYTQFATGFTMADPVTGKTFVVAEPDTNFRIGSAMDIDQTLDLTDAVTTGAQNFVYRDRRGYKGTSAVTYSNAGSYLTSAPLTTAGEMNISGDATPVTWDNTDSITTTLLVQTADAAIIPVAYQSLNVNNDAAKQDSALIFDAPTGPIDWDVSFGTAPTFP
ncbi:MAG: hypothetical protein OEX19_17250 [Gammaproteobacteria bacterium]|nr:hypothetical protein [Gammaproteobacteria bacterium]